MKNDQKGHRFGDWKLFDTLQFLNKLQLSLEYDAPLEYVLRCIFSSVLAKMMRICKCSAGIYLFPNFISETDCETHHIYLDKKGPHKEFLKRILEIRNTGFHSPFDFDPPPFISTRVKGLTATGWKTLIEKLIPDKNLQYPSSDVLSDLIQPFNDERKRLKLEIKDNDSNFSKLNEHYFSEIDFRSDQNLLIPFKSTKFRLGFPILWNNNDDHNSNQIILWRSMEEEIFITSKIIQSSISRFLVSHYHITPDTYLPSYRKEGPNNVAILFADIRGFTTMTEIARNKGFLNELQRFMYLFFENMVHIIEHWKGRADQFSGDSILALFGEYDINRTRTVGFALAAASEMYQKFQALKKNFFAQRNIESFLDKHNEPLEFDLGIGINYGEALFGYFGRFGARKYMPLGDYTNFAQRLENAASRFDPNEKRQLAPILLSRTAFNAIKDFITNKKDDRITPNIVILTMKGKTYEYPVYEIWPSYLKESKEVPLYYAFLDEEELGKEFLKHDKIILSM